VVKNQILNISGLVYKNSSATPTKEKALLRKQKGFVFWRRCGLACKSVQKTKPVVTPKAGQGLFLLNHPQKRITEGNPATPTVENERVTKVCGSLFLCYLHTICIQL